MLLCFLLFHHGSAETHFFALVAQHLIRPPNERSSLLRRFASGWYDTLMDEPTNRNEEESATASEAGAADTGGLLARLRAGLSKTRGRLVTGINWVQGSKGQLSEQELEDTEALLLSADVGVAACRRIVDRLNNINSRSTPYQALRGVMSDILQPVAKPLQTAGHRPFIVLVVGVNGVGKTTTIGKLAKYYQQQELEVMLAAGDTFRAAAVEQLITWGQRNNVPVISQGANADPAAVIFDACSSAQAKGIDILLADTAGRLHTQGTLMAELNKICRVAAKLDASAPHEKLLVLDASIGQNALSQARLFHEAVGLTGVALTKLDGTAKGGIVFALAEEFGLPIRFIGIGEGADDLRVFDVEEFLDALLGDDPGVPAST
jgi:fused signal recognition particle receptor